MHSQSVKIAIESDFNVLINDPASPADELFILLHGFRESNVHIYDHLASPLAPLQAQIIAPCAPFPFRTKTPTGEFALEYSWYFYDPDLKKYLVTMETALQHLERGLKALNLWHKPKRIIGFSQGGYLAPFVGQRLPNTLQVIGIACEFYTKEMQGAFPFPIDAIHGNYDTVVNHSLGKESHRRLLELGYEGQFHTVSAVGHYLDKKVKDKLCEVIQNRR